MKKMLAGLMFLSLILISCSGNDPELNAAPEAVVELSQYAGNPVDLGLSVYWADDNLYGWYQWGSTTSFAHSYSGISGYEIPSDFLYTSIAASEYDPARMQWGGNWRMPTAKECDELMSKCKKRWTNRGMELTGPSGEKIFLTSLSEYNTSGGGLALDDYRESCVYWTASRVTRGDWEGAAMALYCDQFSLNSKAAPCHEANAGRIRPVCDKITK